MRIIIKVLEDMLPYYRDLTIILKEMDNPGISDLEEFYNKKHVNYYVDVLDNDEFDYYFEQYKKFLENLEEYRRNNRSKGVDGKAPKPHAAVHMILPIKRIQEAQYDRLWKKQNE